MWPFQLYTHAKFVAQATKRSLASVCRRWNVLATPMLYTHLDVSGDRKRSQALIRTLSPPQKSETDDIQVSARAKERAVRLGKCVKRLEISVPLSCGLGTDKPHAKSLKSDLLRQQREFAKVTKLIRGLTHLEVFVMAARAHPGEAHVGLDMLQALPPTLQAIHWHISGVQELATSLSSLKPRWVEFYNTHRNLVTVDIPCQLQLSRHQGPTSVNRVHWPPIRHLSLRSVVSIAPATIEIPASLQSVSFLDPVLKKSAPTQFICQFIRAHGKQLTSVGLRLESPHDAPTELLLSLKAGCPRLTQIQLFLPYSTNALDLDQFSTSVGVTVPTVTMLGVEFSRPRCGSTVYRTRSEYTVAVAQLSWKKVFPNLQRVRLLLEADVERFFGVGNTFSERVLDACRTRGIVMEDNFGKPLTESLDVL